MPLDQPRRVVGLAEREEGIPQFLDRLKVAAPTAGRLHFGMLGAVPQAVTEDERHGWAPLWNVRLPGLLRP